MCDGKSYFPSLHVTVSLHPALPHCTIAVAIHRWADLCSGYSRCCSSRLLILVLRHIEITSGRSCNLALEKNGLAYITEFLNYYKHISVVLTAASITRD